MLEDPLAPRPSFLARLRTVSD